MLISEEEGARIQLSHLCSNTIFNQAISLSRTHVTEENLSSGAQFTYPLANFEQTRHSKREVGLMATSNEFSETKGAIEPRHTHVRFSWQKKPPFHGEVKVLDPTLTSPSCSLQFAQRHPDNDSHGRKPASVSTSLPFLPTHEHRLIDFFLFSCVLDDDVVRSRTCLLSAIKSSDIEESG